MKAAVWYLPFSTRLSPLSPVPPRPVHVAADGKGHLLWTALLVGLRAGPPSPFAHRGTQVARIWPVYLVLQWTQRCTCGFGRVFSVSHDEHPEVGRLGDTVALMFGVPCSGVAAPPCSPTDWAQGPLFSAASPTLVCRFAGDGHCDRCGVASRCGFDLRFPAAE